MVSNLGTRRLRIGTPETHTVYAAELEGINAAPVIFTDNQATIQSLQDPGGASGQYILREIVQRVDQLQSAGWHLRIQWIPGHEGAFGNELADKAAKEAAQQAATYHREGARAAARAAIKIPRARRAVDPRDCENTILIATCRQRLRLAAAEQWKAEWTSNPHGLHLRKIFAAPSNRLLDLHTGLRRAASSAIVQLQTGKVALAGYLGTFGAMETTQCSCGEGRQDTEHILVACPNHEELRNEVLWETSRETDYRRILSQALLVRKAAKYILATCLLGQFRALGPNYSIIHATTTTTTT